MAKIGGGSPSTIWKGNQMECTLITHPTRVMNGTKKKKEERILKKEHIPVYKYGEKSIGNSGSGKEPHSFVTYALCTLKWLWNVQG